MELPTDVSRRAKTARLNRWMTNPRWRVYSALPSWRPDAGSCFSCCWVWLEPPHGPRRAHKGAPPPAGGRGSQFRG
ncbi:hypothetical protein C4K24_2269 [Pseudomonas chlororaphis subsp. aurantiaca]|nr:hypothetical protein C4K24_2269 [Pseudomonas chlororaphis subsp. aurantiaca]AZD60207.1 hypothetical protein C4K18_2234 [Pseudomonas chlororaphis subsp. aurantiaca]